MGFIFRTTRNFKSPQSLLVLYKSLVRPVLEYGSVIWSPYQAGHIDILNRVQFRFLRVLGVRLGHDFSAPPIWELEQRFTVQPLLIRRQISDLVFLHKLVSGITDCTNLLDKVSLLIPRGTRSLSVFGRAHQPTNYAYYCGLVRLQRTGNAVSSGVDFFHDSLSSFRRKLIINLS